mmetsp:Transcript_14023/g.19502  ORF Transcript_14023/g.19502 Transcript_14023/m.19502 type:complete len:157 (+) Transcript_14023:42-512(+)
MASQFSWSQVFPDGLIDDKGNQIPVESLKGKLVALYFSASWCPPCRAFSPVLAEFQKKHSEEIQVVLVSLDRDDASFKKYIQGKPWATVPYGSKVINSLCEKHGISSIPTLVILSASGEYITNWGRSAVSKNPDHCIEEWKKGEHGVSWLQILTPW